MSKENTNLGIVIATQAVHSMDSLSKSTNRQIEIYEKIRQAKEENDETANAQKRKAYPHGFSAALSLICSIAGEVLKNAQNPLGEILNSVSRTAPQAASIFSASLDSKVTHHSHGTRVAEVAGQRISQEQSNADSRKKDPKTGNRKNLGTFKTRTAAIKHEREIFFFKKHG